MRTAEHLPIRLHAVADNPTSAMCTPRRKRMNRAFKGIKDVILAAKRHRERLVVIVAAYFAQHHRLLPLERSLWPDLTLGGCLGAPSNSVTRLASYNLE
jgi:hypothetical protein